MLTSTKRLIGLIRSEGISVSSTYDDSFLAHYGDDYYKSVLVTNYDTFVTVGDSVAPITSDNEIVSTIKNLLNNF